MPDTVPLRPARDRIIDAALHCFAQSGFHGASMQEVCAEAGMSPGAVYRYFPSKVAIIAAIAEAERAHHAAFFEKVATADDPVEALASIGLDTLERLLAGPAAALTAETMAEASRNPEIRAMFERLNGEARAHLRAALARGQERGLVDSALDIDTALQLIMAMGDGLCVHQGLDPTLTAARIRPVLQVLLRRFLRPVLALLLLVMPVHAAEPKPPAVTVTTAIQGPIAESAVLTGTLVAREEVLVSPQIEGLAITEILAEEGDRVEAGQVLARLSHDVLDAGIAQNTAQISRTEAAIAQAQNLIVESQANRQQSELALARTRALVLTGNASREVLEQRQASAQMTGARTDSASNALRAAQADQALAIAQRQELLVRLARTELKSPVAGLVSRRVARLGAVAMGAGDPLFRIIQDGTVELEADVPEALLSRLRPGQEARVDTAGGARDGEVRLVAAEVNRSSRLGRVRVTVKGQGLVIGGFARATVETARHDGVLTPLSAVLFQPSGPVVQVVRDGVVETRKIQVGLRNATDAEVTSGLGAGEEVVTVSGTFVRGGDRVTAVSR